MKLFDLNRSDVESFACRLKSKIDDDDDDDDDIDVEQSDEERKKERKKLIYFL